MRPSRDPMTMDLPICARCHCDGGHKAVEFTALTFNFQLPKRSGCEWKFTHWAPCPTNGEPILLILDAPQEAPSKPAAPALNLVIDAMPEQ